MASQVSDQSAAVAAMAEHWPMIDALVGGTKAMRAAGRAFLPQWPKEDESSYQTRLAVATLFPAFSRTTAVLAAKPLSKPIGLGELPPAIAGLIADIDMAGSTLHAFAAQVMLACLRYGLAGVLVECPPAEGAVTRADEVARGIRPYLALYPAKTILGWRSARGPQGTILTQLRLLEQVTEADGDFGEATITQVRVLTPGAWAIWRQASAGTGDREEWVLHSQGTTTLTTIPFVFFYGLRDGFGLGPPPLLDLAYLNVEHWQSASDQQTILHVARVPILFAKGFAEGDSILVGASSAVSSASPDAELKYVEHSGAAIEAGRQALIDTEDRMRQIGAELLVQKPTIATATQTVSEGEASRSILQRITETFEDSLAECLRLMGAWIGETVTAEVEMFKDFGATDLSERSSDILLRAAAGGHVSSETVFHQLRRRDIIAPDLSWDDEQGKLAAKPPPVKDDQPT